MRCRCKLVTHPTFRVPAAQFHQENAMQEPAVYLNGRFVPASQAAVKIYAQVLNARAA